MPKKPHLISVHVAAWFIYVHVVVDLIDWRGCSALGYSSSFPINVSVKNTTRFILSIIQYVRSRLQTMDAIRIASATFSTSFDGHFDETRAVSDLI
jgi:hypothetical protein